MTVNVNYDRGFGGIILTQDQLDEIIELRDQQLILHQNALFENDLNALTGLGVPLYEKLLEFISEYDNEGNLLGPKLGVDKAVWAWINGARYVNAGEGFYADFIREYTKIQFRLRGGSESEAEFRNQRASNDIAFQLINDIVRNLGELPGILGLGAIDAGAAASTVFEGLELHPDGDYAPWAGTLLFPFLKEDAFFQDLLLNSEPVVATFNNPAGNETRVIKHVEGVYDLIAMLQAAEQASFDAGLSNPVTAILTALFGPEAAIDTDQADLIEQANQFFWDYYGLTQNDGFTPGNDLLFTRSFNFDHDYFVGTAGDDTMIAQDRGFFDVLDSAIMMGGDGDDWIAGSGFDDLIDGGNDNDTLWGLDGDDYLYGGHGDDILTGGAGDDQLTGGSGSDRLNGGEDSDALYGQSGHDVLNGGAGSDYLIGGVGSDELNGDAGSDTLYGGEVDQQDDHEQDHLMGGEGEDTYYINSGDIVEDDGGTVYLNGEQVSFNGEQLSQDSEYYYDEDNRVVIHRMDGQAVVMGRDRYFQIEGELSSGAFGFNLNEYTEPEQPTGPAVPIGDAYDIEDAEMLTQGSDVLMPLEPQESFAYAVPNGYLLGNQVDYEDQVIIEGGDGLDWLEVGDTHEGAVYINGGNDNDIISAGLGDDYLEGGAGRDIIFSFEGDDHILGGADSDFLSGYLGNDFIDGGAGREGDMKKRSEILVFKRDAFQQILVMRKV